MTAMPVDRHAMIHSVFKAMDADGSGEIDEAEFMSMFSDKESKHAKRFLETIDGIHAGDAAAGDGQLNAKEFCEFMVDYTSRMREDAFKDQIEKWHANVRGSGRRLLLRKVFFAMDADKSGSISLEEFRALASESEGQDDAADLFRWIEGSEGDGDGELTVDEWVPFVLEREKQRTDADFRTMVDAMLDRLARKKRETLLRQVFLKMDADSSGSVDRAEFDNLKDGEDDDARLNMIYSYLDAAYGDADGELSSDEWVQGMKAMGEDMDDEHFEAEVSKWMAALAKNQRKVWRGVYSRGNARDFVVAARAAGLTHAIFVQSAHASFDGFATGAEEWAPLKHALVSLSPKKQEEDAPSPPLPPPPESKGKGGLARRVRAACSGPPHPTSSAPHRPIHEA